MATSPRFKLGIAGLVLWLVAPLALVAVLTIQSNDTKVAGDATEVVAPVRSMSSDAANAVQIALEWRSGASVSAPNWSGVVQTVSALPGVTLKEGDVIAQIDGIQRIAAVGGVPFYRPMTVGDTGGDVGSLNAILASRQYSSSTGDRFTTATMNGVRALAVAIGVNGRVSAADPSWFVWLPSDQYLVATDTLAAGHPAPPAGQTILTTADVLTGARPVPAGTVDLTSQPNPASSAPASAEGRSNDYSRIALAVPLGADLATGGTTVALNEDRRSVSPEGLRALSEITSSTDLAVAGSIVTHPGLDRMLVPTASVVDAGDQQCVIVSVKGSHHPIRVTIVGDLAGQTIVQSSGLAVGDRVIVAPSSGERSCA